MARDYAHTMPRALAPEALPRLTHIRADPWLLLSLAAIVAFGLVVLESAAHGDQIVLGSQVLRLGLGFVAMLFLAQLSPHLLRRWTPVVYVVGLALLVLVLLAGFEAKGARRWIDLPGLPRFQPSELMKIAVPMAVAWYFHDRVLPPRALHLLVALAMVGVPVGLVAMQPDLGTAVMVAGGGLAVVLLSGVRWRVVAAAGGLAALAAPLLWMLLRDYQKARVLTFLDPTRDPHGAGWNIIQAKTAVGSGGFFGKGLASGTQSQLDFLPESRTDFIVAVIGEELGLVGVILLLCLYLVVIARALYIAIQARDTFCRLAAGGLAMLFFAYVFVNVAMVTGLLPVVGVPLPLVSYGGTSAITLLAGFGLVMAVQNHQN